MNYEIRKIDNFDSVVGILPSGQELWIPADEANSDYQAFLEWVAEGNEPELIEE